jgi:transcriptional regulator with XRE-family HTH domain
VPRPVLGRATDRPSVPKDLEITERVRLRLRTLFDRERQKPIAHRRGTQAKLAERLGIEPGTLSNVLNGRDQHAIRLKHLDTIAAFFEIPPSALIARRDSLLAELGPQERQLLAHWRELPGDVRQQFLELFGFFAGLLPEEQETRRFAYKLSRLRNAGDRAKLEDQLNEFLEAQKRQPAQTDGADPVASDSFDATVTAIRIQQGKRRRR